MPEYVLILILIGVIFLMFFLVFLGLIIFAHCPICEKCDDTGYIITWKPVEGIKQIKCDCAISLEDQT
jgi:hypothetical protein